MASFVGGRLPSRPSVGDNLTLDLSDALITFISKEAPIDKVPVATGCSTRSASTILGQMANLLAVIAPRRTRTFMIVITLRTQRFRPGVWFPVTIACSVGLACDSAFYSAVVLPRQGMSLLRESGLTWHFHHRRAYVITIAGVAIPNSVAFVAYSHYKQSTLLGLLRPEVAPQ
ncbi:hypothetical protein Tco_0012185 [Tanacetum coccineum]